jgi:hypothetical protein
MVERQNISMDNCIPKNQRRAHNMKAARKSCGSRPSRHEQTSRPETAPALASVTVAITLPVGSLRPGGVEKMLGAIALILSTAKDQTNSRSGGGGPRDAENCVRKFIAQTCRRNATSAESAAALFAAFQSWAAEMASPLITKKAFGSAMGSLGFLKTKSSVVSYRGIELRGSAGAQTHVS